MRGGVALHGCVLLPRIVLLDGRAAADFCGAAAASGAFGGGHGRHGIGVMASSPEASIIVNGARTPAIFRSCMGVRFLDLREVTTVSLAAVFRYLPTSVIKERRKAREERPLAC